VNRLSATNFEVSSLFLIPLMSAKKIYIESWSSHTQDAM
jgi:hypothetical protein